MSGGRAGRAHGNGRRPPRLAAVGQADRAQPAVHIGQVLRARREAAGLTQERAAVAAGLTRNTLGSIEKSALPDPHLSTLLALMQVYGLGSLDELLGPMPSMTLAESWQAKGWSGGRPHVSDA